MRNVKELQFGFETAFVDHQIQSNLAYRPEFNAPKALDKLHELKNIKLKMFLTDEDRNGFHTKGYMFKKEEFYRIIVGSSNMTAKALKVNRA